MHKWHINKIWLIWLIVRVPNIIWNWGPQGARNQGSEPLILYENGDPAGVPIFGRPVMQNKTFLSTVTQKLIWNHFLQREHWIISVPESSDIQHEQNIAMVFIDLTQFSLRLYTSVDREHCKLPPLKAPIEVALHGLLMKLELARWVATAQSCGKCNCEYSTVVTTCLHLDVHEMNKSLWWLAEQQSGTLRQMKGSSRDCRTFRLLDA